MTLIFFYFSQMGLYLCASNRFRKSFRFENCALLRVESFGAWHCVSVWSSGSGGAIVTVGCVLNA